MRILLSLCVYHTCTLFLSVYSSCDGRNVPNIMYELHWLSVRFRIEYKFATLVDHRFDGSLPPYFSSLLNIYQPSRSLGSSDEKLLSLESQHRNIQSKVLSVSNTFSLELPSNKHSQHNQSFCFQTSADIRCLSKSFLLNDI